MVIHLKDKFFCSDDKKTQASIAHFLEITTITILAVQEAIFRKLVQYSSLDEGRFREEPTANLLLRRLCAGISDVPEKEFITWLVTENNKLCYDDLSTDALKLIHGIFAQPLWEYHKQCNPNVNFPDSHYLRDVTLHHNYGLLSTVMLIKHARSQSNLAMLKFDEYYGDNIYFQLDKPDESNTEPTPLGGAVNYKEDPDFKKIVEFHNEPGNFLFFTGIPNAKGGLSTLLEILIDNLALIRFCGSLGVESSRKEDAAYGHGPFFMCFSRFEESEVPNQPLLRVSANDITFILPTETDRKELLASLKAAVNLNLLAPDLSEKLTHNIMTYETYASKYCTKNTVNFSSNPSSFFNDSSKNANRNHKENSTDDIPAMMVKK